jgi:hypothetical protein
MLLRLVPSRPPPRNREVSPKRSRIKQPAVPEQQNTQTGTTNSSKRSCARAACGTINQISQERPKSRPESSRLTNTKLLALFESEDFAAPPVYTKKTVATKIRKIGGTGPKDIARQNMWKELWKEKYKCIKYFAEMPVQAQANSKHERQLNCGPMYEHRYFYSQTGHQANKGPKRYTVAKKIA